VADLARQVADQFQPYPVWRFTVTDDGRIVHEGRLHYRPTAAQKSYVRARDRECKAPGRQRPAHQSDIDHVTAWEENGITHEDNLCVICRRHHRAKHGGFSLYRTDFGLVWISPRGVAYPVTYGRELDPSNDACSKPSSTKEKPSPSDGERQPQATRACSRTSGTVVRGTPGVSVPSRLRMLMLLPC
jgi:hypothetical protein